jgi:hypothetical protein
MLRWRVAIVGMLAAAATCQWLVIRSLGAKGRGADEILKNLAKDGLTGMGKPAKLPKAVQAQILSRGRAYFLYQYCRLKQLGFQDSWAYRCSYGAIFPRKYQ